MLPGRTAAREIDTRAKNISGARAWMSIMPLMDPRNASRIIRPGDQTPDDPWKSATPAERMSAVWELTLQCLAWRGEIEPRLQRSIVCIQRARR